MPASTPAAAPVADPAPTEVDPAPTAAVPSDLADPVVSSQTPQPLRGDETVCEDVLDGAADPERGVRRALVAAVVVAALAAATFGALWALAATSSALELARDRDAALADARQAAINLNTLDYRNVGAGLDLWQQSSTGQVLAEFQQNRDQYAKLVQESRRMTVATVPDAAVTELDEHAGVARVLVAVDVTVTPDGQAPAVTRQRLQMEMARTPAGWKVDKLNPVRSPGAAGTAAGGQG